MRKFVTGVLNRRFIVLFISLLLLLLGIYSYIHIPKQEMPEIDAPWGTIQVTVPGYSSRQVQDKVIKDIEDIIKSYSEVKDFSAIAYDNAAIVKFELYLDTKDADDVLSEMESKITNADLDEGVSDVNVTTEYSAPEVIYAIHSSTLSEYELKEIAEALKKELKDVSLVSKVEVNASFSKEIVVKIDFDALDKTPLTVIDINNIITAKAIELPLGKVEVDGNKEGSIIVKSKFTSIEEIEEIIIFEDDSGKYLLQDVANISIENVENKKTYVFNGEKVAFVEMYFEEGIDFIALGDETKAVVNVFEKTIDEEAAVTAMTFSPDYVKDQVGQVMINLLECMAIVMLVILIGLGVRNALVIAAIIPVIVMSTLGILYYTNNSLQLMTIAGLIVSIGILVDNAIVISDAVQHNLDSGMERKKASVQAIVDNYLPVLTSTLTTIAAFLPLLALPGIAGEVAFSLPFTIIIAISLSLIVAMVLSPVLASMLFKPSKNAVGKKHEREFKFLSKGIKAMFKLSVIPTIVAFILLAVTAFTAFSVLDIDMMPRPEKSVVYIDYEYGEINNSEETLRYAKAIEQVILAQDDIISYGYSQGGNFPKFDMSIDHIQNMPQNGRFFINFDCRPKEISQKNQILRQQLRPLGEYGSISVERIELNAPGAPVQVVLKSDNQIELSEKAREIYKKIESLDSFDYGELNLAERRLDFELEFNEDELDYYGLTVIDVEKQIAHAVNGQRGELYEDDIDELDVVVLTDIENTNDLLELSIITPDRQKVLLEDLVYSDEVRNLEYISSIEGKYSTSIDAYMGDDYNTFDLQRGIEAIINETEMGSVDVSYKGENELTSELFGGLGLALGIALIAIYLIMYFQFNSLLQPLIIFISIPLSFIGSFLALIILNESITLTGMLGLVSLVGIVVNNGILLVENINRLRKEGESIYNSCLKATNRRLRPILLTSITTILGLLPLALFGGDMFRPLAISFMGGLIVSAVLVLFMVPSLYYLMYKKYDRKLA